MFQKEVEIVKENNDKSQKGKLEEVPDKRKEYESTTDHGSAQDTTTDEETTRCVKILHIFFTIFVLIDL